MIFKDVDLFDINRVKEISYIKLVKTGKNKFSIFWEHFCLLFKPFYKKTKLKKAEILFYGVTINNQRTFSTILENLKHSYYNLDNNEDSLMSGYILFSILGIPYIVRLYLHSDAEHRRIIRTNRVTYLLSYGKLISTRRVLKKVKPKILIMANDHSPMNRCFLWNATNMGIKTVYTQHASVSNEFPPLTFDYSFLDGEVSFDAYGRNSKSGSIVCLSGPCRFDYMKDYLNGDKKHIGLSLNEMDDFDMVKDLCLFLKDNGCEKIKVRPHPSMGLWHADWFSDNGIVFSTPAAESPGEYLSTLKLQISNVSGIHLDAIILKTPTVLFQLSVLPIADVFHFLEHNVVFMAQKNTILNFIKAPSLATPTDDAVRYFISSYQTKIEFSVGPFIASIVDCLLDYNFDNKTVLSTLGQLVGNEIKVYSF